jgi:hypothetical protein
MSRKLFAVSFFAALAIGILLLFGLSGDVSATTIKLNYATAADCGGADDSEGTTADNSCTAGTAKNLNSTADVETIFDIKVGHSNYANTRTVLASPAFNIAMDASIPNGAFIGNLTTLATLSLLNAPCVSAIPVTIPFFDATTDVTNTIDWTGDGSNLTVDTDGNGLADGIDKYPSFLNIMFNSQKPLARYYGYTVATGTVPTQLNFVIFAPGVLAGTTSAPGMPKPDQEMNASLGYINYVALNNPAPGQPAAPATISDVCTPLNVTTRLLGKTAGEGRSIGVVGTPELSAQCSGAGVGVDSDSDTVVDDGCIVVNDRCGDGIDNDGDTKKDEYCVNATGLYAARTRSTNPTSATSGIYGSGTHLAGAYLQGGRDADNDGIENAMDSCPTTADGRETVCGELACADGNGVPPWDNCDDDGDGAINDGCARIGAAEVYPSPNQCSDNLNQDGDATFNDGCPPIQVDANANGLGDACENAGNCTPADDDCDNDGFQNRQDNCPVNANATQLDLDSNRCYEVPGPGAVLNDDSPDDTRFNDGCPAQGAKETTCTEASCVAPLYCDNDSDTFANDGCPLAGGISEFCVVSNGDFGPCSDSIGDACDAAPLAVDGDYDKDFPRVAVCIGATDTDGDGWCDDTETLLGSDPASNTSAPENAGIDYPIDPAPQSCSNMEWYASSGDPIGDGATVDDDGDTLVNAADPSCLMLSGACPSDDADCDGVVTGPGTLCDGIVPTGVAAGAAYQTPAMKQVQAAAATDACILFNDDDDWAGTWWDDINTVTVNDPPACTGHTITVGEVGAYEGIKIVWTPAGCVANGDPITVDFQAVVAGPLDNNGKAAPCRGPIWTDSSGNPVQIDNCASVYNPEQTNSDTAAIGGGDALGDACDPNDDGDGLIDTAEWSRGSDAKNPFSPFMLDIDGNTSVQGADASALKAWIGTSIGAVPAPSQVCLP